MEAKFISPELINSDLGVVNAARVSLAKESKLVHEATSTPCWFSSQESTGLCINPGHWVLSSQDKKLLKYLASHNHWTPFAHSSLYVKITWANVQDELDWYKYYNPAGFQRVSFSHYGEDNSYDILKGSLIGWIHNLYELPSMLVEYIEYHLRKNYPESTNAYFKSGEEYFKTFDDSYCHGGEILSESVLQAQGIYDIIAATLRVKVPIAIARQIRTSQVGFSYNDLYVEGESFAFNEISRRYVNDDPEFYKVEQWRVREGKSIKQGSTGIADNNTRNACNSSQSSILEETQDQYKYLNKNYNIAPEQLRFLLPQSMYTEFYMTGTLKRWKQFIRLRSQGDVMEETREITSRIAQELQLAYPEWV